MPASCSVAASSSTRLRDWQYTTPASPGMLALDEAQQLRGGVLLFSTMV